MEKCGKVRNMRGVGKVRKMGEWKSKKDCKSRER
jgi:hypothetical protein